MSDLVSQECPPAPPPSTWRKRLVIGSGVLATLVLGWFGVVAYVSYQVERDLRSAIDEADRLDPDWRLDDLLARCADVPAAENGANVIAAVVPLVPASWPSQDTAESGKYSQALRRLPPPVQLDATLHRYLVDALEEVEQAEFDAQRLVDRPRGRFALVYSPDYISTILNAVQNTRRASRVLTALAVLQAQEGQQPDALRSCRASFHAGRSIGEEPMMIAVMIRFACHGITISALERVLAQGEGDAAELAALQRILEDETQQPLQLLATRGERAGIDRYFEAIDNGYTPVIPLSALAASGDEPASAVSQASAEVMWQLPGARLQCRTRLLRLGTQQVEIARRPYPEQKAALDELMAQVREAPPLVRALCTGADKFAQACQRVQALLLTTMTALAVERYRLKHGHWPSALADVCPELLKEVPVDPYDGKPLRFRRVPDGVVVYSVGLDRTDNGGNLQRQKSPYEPGTDLGFQLWDLEKRRQAPREQ